MWRHIAGWVNITGAEVGGGRPDNELPGGGPVDPGYGRPGWSPVDPGYGRPDWGGGRPDNELPGGGGHIWGALIRWVMRPSIGGGPIKPPGLPVLPVDPSWDIPVGRPGFPGDWVPVDPGYGKPPLWGWRPVDPGFGIDVGGGGGERPDNSLPGHWVPVDPDFGKPIRPCPPVGGKPHPPLWIWIAELPDFGGKPKVTLYPTSATVLASGGSGSINVTSGAENWTVDPASVPGWVTINPMTGPDAQNFVYSATQNTTGVPRQAFIKVSGATFTLNQGAV